MSSCICRIHIFHLVNGGGTDDVVDADDVLMFEAQQYLDLPQGSLAVGLVLKRADLLDGHTDVAVVVEGGAVEEAGQGGHITVMPKHLALSGAIITECTHIGVSREQHSSHRVCMLITDKIRHLPEFQKRQFAHSRSGVHKVCQN